MLEFEALCGESACAPWYDERRDDRDPRSRALRTCTMWRLLRLHGGAARPNGALLPLTSVTAPDAISPNVLDVALPWHLWHALASLDAVRGTRDEQEPTADKSALDDSSAASSRDAAPALLQHQRTALRATALVCIVN